MEKRKPITATPYRWPDPKTLPTRAQSLAKMIEERDALNKRIARTRLHARRAERASNLVSVK